MTVLAILDLEFTAWEGSRAREWTGPGEEKEIVEVGAVLLAGDSALTETASLNVLVRPVINPALSDYFITLTGITQESVDNDGVGFPDALDRLADFLAPAASVYSMGTDFMVVRRNCELNGVPFPFDDGLFANFRDTLTDAGLPDIAGVDSGRLPDVMGFARPGQSHRAVDDCRSIADAMRQLRRDGKF